MAGSRWFTSMPTGWSSVREIDDLDLDADLAQSVTAVEWGQGLVEHLTDEHLLIELSLQPGNQAGAAVSPAPPR
ncbi:MAG: hypothetical protein WKF47_01270 [Geodermatophilaceae bacterium]